VNEYINETGTTWCTLSSTVHFIAAVLVEWSRQRRCAADCYLS